MLDSPISNNLESLSHNKTNSFRWLVLLSLVINSCAVFKPQQPEATVVPVFIEKPAADVQTNKEIGVRHIEKYLSERSSKFWTERNRSLYRHTSGRLAWNSIDSLSAAGKKLVQTIESASKEGLNKIDYHYYPIQLAAQKLKFASLQDSALYEHIVYLDLLLTDSYLEYASDLLTGKINPNELTIIWETHPSSRNLSKSLHMALQSGDIEESLRQLRPQSYQYRKLRKALADFRQFRIQDQWERLGYFEPQYPGDTSRHVVKIKGYLANRGYLPNNDGSKIYSDELSSAVMDFQQHHDLPVDGVVGENTLVAMNRPPGEYIQQIRVNMERLRWLPRKKGSEHLLVNLPEFKLRYYNHDSLELVSKIIVGEKVRSTPVLIDTLEYLVFSPTWNIPRSIATDEFLPRLKRSTDFLKEDHFLILSGSLNSVDTINPDSVHWQKLSRNNFPYRIMQSPGEHNALGQIKFIFPNRKSIYLHDTPSPYLFEESKRTFSHGCIRVEKPIALADSLLPNENLYSRDSLISFTQLDKPKRVWIPREVPVYFQYQTVRAGRKGEIYFHDDIYDFDRQHLVKLLQSE